LWLGRWLQLVAVTLVLVALPWAFVPDQVYWAASYFALLGLTPEPFIFNALLLGLVGAAAKRRKRGVVVFIVLFEIPVALTAGMMLVLLDLTGPPDWGAVALDGAAGLVALGLIGLVLACRQQFSARLSPANWRAALAALLGGVVTAVLAGGIYTELRPGGLESPHQGWLWALLGAVGLFPNVVLADDVGIWPQPAVLLVTSISAAGLLAAVLILVRSAQRQRLLSRADELEVRRLLAESKTEDSLAYFATRRDKSVLFTEDHKAAVSYRVVGGVALASGDPLGPGQHWGEAVAHWLKTMRSFGFRPAATSTSEAAADCYARHGLRSLVMGEEAILRTDGHTARDLLADKELAAARRRVRRAGYRARVRRQADCSPDELALIARLADDWRQGGPERGFSMALSRVGDPTDGQAVVVTAHDRFDQMMGLLIFAPWNRDGLSLDVMRRHPAAVGSVTEFMVTALVARAEELGVTRLSLNFAMFRETFVAGARAGAGRLLRAQRALLMVASRWWQLDSLRRANEKYHPLWRRRLLNWERGLSLLRVGAAVARAEGFLPGPRWRPEAEAVTPEFCRQVAALEAVRAEAEPKRPAAVAARRRKAATLAEAGVELYPAAVPTSCGPAQVLADGSVWDGREMTAVGRIVGRRRHGGVAFLDLLDLAERRTRLQVIASADRTVRYRELGRLDLGDIVSVSGRLGHSRTGWPSLIGDDWRLAAKSLQPLPGQCAGRRRPAGRRLPRHVELACDSAAADLIVARSKAVGALRQGLLQAGYLEVETPILQAVHGGANARPFRTHINAHHVDLSLRIAPELALKRLVVAGFPQVFEIGRNFRNEGVDASHNPEFTAVEAYCAWADYQTMRRLARELIWAMAVAVHGRPVALAPDGTTLDLDQPWPQVTVCRAVSQAVGVEVSPDGDPAALRRAAADHGLAVRPGAGPGRLIEDLYAALVEPATVAPTFYTDFPAETSPLARPHRSVSGLAERWDLVACGMELGTAYSELTDPVEQRRRLMDQSLRAAHGDPEAMEVDESFLEALEFGLPPTGGLGLGVDRLVMLLTGANIRQTLTFPFVRPVPGRRG
jgi:lysyl-tRNA synthetase class 2